ncbi:MAG: ribosomal-processing cysteine protease Prp [Candidatus Eremiobacteraeota bacterium]|nr:ribosomal-processing cysteine protease Prp [Candidatus Eremiobacteraeota bacterium]NNM93344.1 ribosomal-processing cysteine protease Prp [Candidatus Eremiobacteraeota bacterium]
MLRVTFYEDSRQRLSSFVAKGHTELAAHGEDIVCAAISAILQAARLGLEQHAAAGLTIRQQSGDMELAVASEDRDREDVRAILGTALLACDAIAAQYPDAVAVRRETEAPVEQ